MPVLAGDVADDPRGGRARPPSGSGGGVVVVKAQVKIGGRGKAGGVKLAETPDEAAEHAPTTSSAWTSRATPSTR